VDRQPGIRGGGVDSRWKHRRQHVYTRGATKSEQHPRNTPRARVEVATRGWQGRFILAGAIRQTTVAWRFFPLSKLRAGGGSSNIGSFLRVFEYTDRRPPMSTQLVIFCFPNIQHSARHIRTSSRGAFISVNP
jgi:hypothetical protein